jgi:hypothetical protein
MARVHGSKKGRGIQGFNAQMLRPFFRELVLTANGWGRHGSKDDLF